MIEDQVLIEIRKIKDDLASEYGYDVRKMLNDAVKRQKNSEHRIVNLSMKKRSDSGIAEDGRGASEMKQIVKPTRR